MHLSLLNVNLLVSKQQLLRKYTPQVRNVLHFYKILNRVKFHDAFRAVFLCMIAYVYHHKIVAKSNVFCCKSISEPAAPDISDVEILITDKTVRFLASGMGRSVKATDGNIDGYFYSNEHGTSSSGLVGVGENIVIEGLQPATAYNFSFYSFIEAIGGVNGSTAAVVSNVCTGEIYETSAQFFEF